MSQHALAQVELLNQQIAALRRQLGALEQALNASESRNTESQTQIADLGQRLNVALAQRVQELSRYRSDFFGRLRKILADRPDIEVVGDRFVLPASVLFSTASDDLSDAAQGELDKLATRSSSLKSRSRRRSTGSSASTATPTSARSSRRPLPFELGAVGGAGYRGRALSHRSRHQARSIWSPPASANSSRSTPATPKKPTPATAASS